MCARVSSVRLSMPILRRRTHASSSYINSKPVRMYFLFMHQSNTPITFRITLVEGCCRKHIIQCVEHSHSFASYVCIRRTTGNQNKYAYFGLSSSKHVRTPWATSFLVSLPMLFASLRWIEIRSERFAVSSKKWTIENSDAQIRCGMAVLMKLQTEIKVW